MLKIKSDEELKESKSEMVEIEGDPDMDCDVLTVEMPQMPDYELTDQDYRPGEEGNTQVHGKIVIRSSERSALFSRNLDQLVQHIVCGVCSGTKKTFHTWREHCQNSHSAVPGFISTLIDCSQQIDAEEFASIGGVRPYECSSCDRTFSTLEARENHQRSVTRTVRLVCPQCNGQYSNLEAHIEEVHTGCLTCGICSMETYEIIAHCHTLHAGFNSVLVESIATCFGDGITTELFETVLETSIEFLVSEVKPEPKVVILPSSKPIPTPVEQLTARQSRSIVSETPRVSITPNILLKARTSKDTPADVDLNASNLPVSVEALSAARDKKNADDFKRYFLSGATPERHDCEICGFMPYTKNKYREKQDHLTKVHFKEKIDALIPVARTYTCPAENCEYNAKDRQDILRHYTGKHNILKMWVEHFLKTQIAKLRNQTAPEKKTNTGLLRSSQETPAQGLTFAQMEKMAIDKEYGVAEDILGIRMTTSPPLKPDKPAKPKQTRNILPKPQGVLEGVAHDLLSTPTTGTVTISTPSGQISLSRQKRKSSETALDSYTLIPVVKPDSVPLYLYKCDQCEGNIVFKSKQGLQAHKMSEHDDHVDNVGVDPLAAHPADPLSNEDASQYVCPNCLMNFPTTKALTLHRSICREPGTTSDISSSFLPPSLGPSLLKKSIITSSESIITSSESILSSSESILSSSQSIMITPEEPPKKKAKRPPPKLLPII